MSKFAFTPDQRVTLLAAALPAFVAKGLEHLPPRGKAPEDGSAPPVKLMPGQLGRCAAAWALDAVDSLEYRINSDIEYQQKRADDARAKAGAS